MTEIALMLGIVLVSFGFLLIAHSVIAELAEEAKADAAKNEQRNGASLLAKADSTQGSGAIRTA